MSRMVSYEVEPLKGKTDVTSVNRMTPIAQMSNYGPICFETPFNVSGAI